MMLIGMFVYSTLTSVGKNLFTKRNTAFSGGINKPIAGTNIIKSMGSRVRFLGQLDYLLDKLFSLSLPRE